MPGLPSQRHPRGGPHKGSSDHLQILYCLGASCPPDLRAILSFHLQHDDGLVAFDYAELWIAILGESCGHTVGIYIVSEVRNIFKSIQIFLLRSK